MPVQRLRVTTCTTSSSYHMFVALPDTIKGSDDMGISVGEPSDPYTITVYSGETPVPNVVVQAEAAASPVAGYGARHA